MMMMMMMIRICYDDDAIIVSVVLSFALSLAASVALRRRQHLHDRAQVTGAGVVTDTVNHFRVSYPIADRGQGLSYPIEDSLRYG
jgi:NO-binding membrane sensor protein with MHYT domain